MIQKLLVIASNECRERMTIHIAKSVPSMHLVVSIHQGYLLT